MKGRKHRETGGENEAEADIKVKPENRSYTGDKSEGVTNEAEEMKKGGRARKKKARGGGFGPEKHGTDEPKVMGDKPKSHAGRKPRKAGGRASSNANPFTSARSGKDAPGRKLMKDDDGIGGER